jgi:hypothetical protein
MRTADQSRRGVQGLVLTIETMGSCVLMPLMARMYVRGFLWCAIVGRLSIPESTIQYTYLNGVIISEAFLKCYKPEYLIHEV